MRDLTEAVGTIVSGAARILISAGVVLLMSSCVWDETYSTTLKADRYRAAVEDVMSRYHAPGVVAGVWAPGDAPWRMAFGVADAASQQPMSLEAHFSIRSVTKSFTVTVLLQLARDGALSLDDPIGRYIAGIPNGDTITLAQLAAMESGIAEYTDSPSFRELFGDDPAHVFTANDLVGYAIPLSPLFDPAAQYKYSNTNTVLLGAVIEKVTQMPLAATLQSRIFGPLQLAQTSYPSIVPLPDPHPLPYSVDPTTGALDLEPFISPTSLNAAGAMVSTVDDLGVWARALGTGSLLTPELQALRLAHSRPATNGPIYDVYGLGIGMLNGWWGHTGSGVGFQAATFYDPRSGATIAVLVNATPSSSVFSRDDNIAQDVFTALASVVAER